jgi:hypothetical protein
MATLEERLNNIASGKKRYENAEPVKWLGSGEDPYIQQPPEEAATFEKANTAFLNRPVKSAPMVAKNQINVDVPIKDIPVSPKVQELQQIFSTQAPIAPEQAAPQMAATSDLVDMDRIREQAASMMPEQGMGDWLTTLAPLATEAVFGGGKAGGVSYGIAGKAATDKVAADLKRQQTLEDKLMEIQKARVIAGAKSGKSATFSPIKIEDPDTGHSIIAAQSRIDGSVILPDGRRLGGDYIRSAGVSGSTEYDRKRDVVSAHKRADADYLGSNTKINPQTGELEVIRSGRSIPIQTGEAPKEFNKKQQQDAQDMISDFTKSPAYQDSVNSLAIAPTVTSLLDAAQRSSNPNSIAGSSVVLTMIRQAQKVGVASDRDAAALGGTQQWAESIDRIQNKVLGQGGPLTLRDIQELREISDIYKKRSQNLLKSHYDESKGAYSKLYGFSNDQIEGQLGAKVKPYMSQSEKSLKSPSLPEGISFGGSTQYPPKSRPNATVPYSVDGKLFWAEPGNDEAIKKENPKAKRLN